MIRTSLFTVLAVLMAAAVGLSACGRKGPLDRPPGTSASSGETKTAKKSAGRPDRPFILDGLLR